MLEFYTSEKRKRRALALIAQGIACLGRAEPQYSALHGPAGSGEGWGCSRGQENGGLFDFDCASLRYRQRVLHTGAEAQKPSPSFCQSGNATVIRFWWTRPFWIRNDQCIKKDLSLVNVRPLKKKAVKSNALHVITVLVCASEIAICEVIIEWAQWAFSLAKMSACEENLIIL